MGKNCFVYIDKELYELMHKEGKRRFGSECKHEKTKNGHCMNCLRRVISNANR